MGPRVIGEEHEIFRHHLERWGVPAEVIDGVMGYHSTISYAPGSVVFRQGSPADIMFWVVRGVVKVYCKQANGSRILVRLVGSGEILGEVDGVDQRGQWVRMFEAQTLTRCSFAMVTRQHVVKLLEELGPTTMVEMTQKINAAWAARVSYFAGFLGYSFRQRLEIVLRDLGVRFGVREKEGILLTFEAVHADLAEMIGSSRPMVSRLMAELLKEKAIARRGKQYILLDGGCLMSDMPAAWPAMMGGTAKGAANGSKWETNSATHTAANGEGSNGRGPLNSLPRHEIG